jgi:aspartyl protease family protein
MIFIGVALLIAVGLALAVNADVGAAVGLTQQQAGEILTMLMVFIIVAGGAFARRRRFGELLVGLLLWVGVFGVVLTGYANRDDIMSVATRVYGELAPGKPVVDRKTGTVTVRRGLGGHFDVDARINGATVPLIFDTGASAMVLTSADARRAGLNPGNLRYDTAGSTANGVGRAARVTLDTIDIGGIVRHNIRAYVTEAGALDTSLLGMTFLETLTRYAVTRDALQLTD